MIRVFENPDLDSKRSTLAILIREMQKNGILTSVIRNLSEFATLKLLINVVRMSNSFLYFISGHWFDDSEPARLVTLSEDSDFAPEFVLNNADKYQDMLMHKL